jgi:hypothetical protein
MHNPIRTRAHLAIRWAAACCSTDLAAMAVASTWRLAQMLAPLAVEVAHGAAT